MTRMLARRVRTRTVTRDERAVRDSGDAISVDVPELRRQRAYARHYYATALHNVLKRPRLLVERRYPRYRTEFRFADDDIAHRVALVVEWRVNDAAGAMRVSIRDVFIILELEPVDVDALGSRDQRSALHADVLDAPRLPALGSEARPVTVTVPDDMGARYGRVSGDMNMVHTSRLGAGVRVRWPVHPGLLHPELRRARPHHVGDRTRRGPRHLGRAQDLHRLGHRDPPH